MQVHYDEGVANHIGPEPCVVVRKGVKRRQGWELEVGARVARIGNSSLAFELAIFLKGGTDALVTGEIVWVYTNQKTHRPIPIPKSIRDFIATRERHLA